MNMTRDIPENLCGALLDVKLSKPLAVDFGMEVLPIPMTMVLFLLTSIVENKSAETPLKYMSSSTLSIGSETPSMVCVSRPKCSSNSCGGLVAMKDSIKARGWLSVLARKDTCPLYQV